MTSQQSSPGQALYDLHGEQGFRLQPDETLPHLLRRIARWIESQPKHLQFRAYALTVGEPDVRRDALVSFVFTAPWGTRLGSDEDPEERRLRLQTISAPLEEPMR